MGPETPLRVAGPGDAEVVTALIGSFRDYLEGSSPSDEAIAAIVPGLIADPNAEFLLAGEPEVGFAQIRFRPSVWTGSDDAWLEDVYVVEDARGKGIGRLLTEAAVQRAKKRGCGRIQLETNMNNRQAVSLYEAIGFRASHLPERWGEEPDICFTLELG